MDSHSILSQYSKFAENTITDRFFKHSDLLKMIGNLSDVFSVTTIGYSEERRSLNLIKWGAGKTKIFLWSQMHGDEATGTMALMDLCGYLNSQLDKEGVEMLAKQCTIYLFPMVNPDGAERFTRRNALQIDLNRDFLQTVSPEALLLKQIRADIAPDFGFNLHDQNTLWSVQKTGNPATLSFLAPAYDEALNVNDCRKKAMLVIADIMEELDEHLPHRIGLFDDEHEPRAFGDNFQKAGTSTILIEAGGSPGDPEKQDIRKYYFLSILRGLYSIATRSYEKQDLTNYYKIPKNTKEIFHVLIRQVMLGGIQVSIGLNAEETLSTSNPKDNNNRTVKKYTVEDIGDLRFCNGYEVYDGKDCHLNGNVIFNETAKFELQKDDKIILSFSNGIRVTHYQ